MVAVVARIASLVATWLFLAAVVVQVFFAGLALFAGGENWALHVNLGWILHLAPLLVLALVALGRPPRSALWLAIALAGVTLVQPLLATLRRDVPLAAALHPVLALLIFSLSLSLAVQLTASLAAARRRGDGGGPERVAPSPS